jgi:hypothetical protein
MGFFLGKFFNFIKKILASGNFEDFFYFVEGFIRNLSENTRPFLFIISTHAVINLFAMMINPIPNRTLLRMLFRHNLVRVNAITVF